MNVSDYFGFTTGVYCLRFLRQPPKKLKIRALLTIVWFPFLIRLILFFSFKTAAIPLTAPMAILTPGVPTTRASDTTEEVITRWPDITERRLHSIPPDTRTVRSLEWVTRRTKRCSNSFLSSCPTWERRRYTFNSEKKKSKMDSAVQPFPVYWTGKPFFANTFPLYLFLKVSEILARSALLQWGPPLREGEGTKFDSLEPISESDFRYEVLLSDKGKDGKYRPIFNGQSVDCRLTDLRPCTEYHIRIHALMEALKGKR